MNRNEFLTLGGAALAGLMTAPALAKPARHKARTKHPVAITMWDFSWLERRWDGAGYEDWDVALDDLVRRGYNAVRIDAYPHLIHFGAKKDWLLMPPWDQQVWGSPDVNRVQVLPALTDFIGRCHKRGIKVGLSTWYREDADNVRMKITSPEIMAQAWTDALDAIKAAGLIDALLYVDMCNEWPLDVWAPFFTPNTDQGSWQAEPSRDYMQRATTALRAHYPDLPLVFSATWGEVEQYLDYDLPYLDLFEQHIWAVGQNDGEFYKLVDYNYERFSSKGYRNLSLKAADVYHARPDYWKGLLTDKIDRMAAVSHKLSKPVITTECWAIVDYKDWPLLKWDWVKELCETGVRRAAGTGQWLGIATSNFCGPQFVGMWRDIDWHLRMTEVIKSAPIDQGLHQGKLWERI